MKSIQRTFLPGSQWVYIKLYTGNKIADDMLIQVISPVIKELKKKIYIDKWFFIRYTDPDFHLRIRLWVIDVQYIGEIICLFQKKMNYWNKNNLLWKMQLDTYNRELERYGGPLIEEAESLFYSDSECILSVLKKLNNNENYRWMIALKLIDSLLSDFSFEIQEKKQLMETLSNSFKAEFGFNKYNSKQFNTKFRGSKSVIEAILENTINDEKFVDLYIPIKKRSKELIPIVEQINMKLKRSKANIDKTDLLKNYLHMMIDRLFRSKNRMHELILYDFMYRYYIGNIAKIKYNQK
jgi:thiopeptide-type bacteriocin biosynthesis protein